MFSHSLDLTCIRWEAEQSNGEIIKTGNGSYEKIDRETLESFALTFRNKPILQVRPNKRTLVTRLKTWNKTFIETGATEQMARFWIVALLAKPQSKETTQHVQCEFDPKWNKQCYDFDFEESSIYYLLENGKTEIRTRFGHITPFTPLHLRAEEFKHLMGIEDPTKRKIQNDYRL